MPQLAAEYEYTDAELLALFRECYAKIAVQGQSYQFGGRTFTRADLAEVQRQITFLENRIAQASTGLRVVPIRLKRAT